MVNPCTGRRCVVLGSAPLARPLTIAQDEIVVAVNGGISSFPLCDVWIVNSRNLDSSQWSPAQTRLSSAMLKQAQGRTVDVVVFLTKHDGAEEWTLRFLKRQGTTVRSTIAIHNEQRRAIESEVGARSADMAKQALSLGMFAAAWCLGPAGASSVRLEGMSWAAGYEYLPDENFVVRGHLAGDKQALARLMEQYPERLSHHITGERVMSKKTAAARASRTAASSRPAGDAPAKPTARSRMREAREAVKPAAERKRAREAAERKAAERPMRSRQRIVRATETTFYDNRRRRTGDEFALRDPTHFRPSCMEDVDPNAPKPAPASTAGTAVPRLQPDGVTPIADDVSRTGKGRQDNPLGVD